MNYGSKEGNSFEAFLFLTKFYCFQFFIILRVWFDLGVVNTICE